MLETTEKTLNSFVKEESLLLQGEASQLNPMHEARVKDGNLNLSRGLSSLSEDNVQKIRSSISSGQYEEAERIIHSMQALVKEDEVEKKFEYARVLCFKAEFEKAKAEFHQILASKTLAPISKMTAHQLLAICNLELFLLDEALDHVDEVIALESIFFRAEAGLFARSLKVRILAKMQCRELAKLELCELQSRITSDQYLLSKKYQLIVYLMAKISFLEENEILLSALGGYFLARDMESSVHQGIFMSYLAILSRHKEFNVLVNTIAKKEKYVAHFFNKLQEELKFKEAISAKVDLKVPKKIILLAEGWCYDLEEQELSKLALTSQFKTTLSVFLKNEEVSKEILFKEVWGGEFNPINDDTKIRTTLRKMRKMGINIVSSYGELSLEETIILP